MLATYLANIKSSGIYRFTFDKSEIPGGTLQTARLVVGYSEKGPFNTVVYIKNASQFKETYGGISKKLERYGDFFHRTALQCLTKEPIYCLNLKPFTKNEIVGKLSFNVGSINITVTNNTNVKDIFDRSRFWVLDPEKLDSSDKYISICATDTLKCSNTVFMRPSATKLGGNLTLREWYNTYNGGEYPDYLEPVLDTLVDEYLMDVYVFRGQFTDDLKKNFPGYFTADGKLNDTITVSGQKKDALAMLASNDASGFIAKYTGSIIPYFKNTDGSYYSIDLKFNDDNSVHQMMMHLNEDYLTADNVKNISLFNLTASRLPGNSYASSSAFAIATWTYDSDKSAITFKDNETLWGSANVICFSGFTKTDKTVTFTLAAGDVNPFNKGDKFMAKTGWATVQDVVSAANGKDKTKIDYTVTFDIAPASGSDLGYDKTTGLQDELKTAGLIKFVSNASAHVVNAGRYISGYTYSSMTPSKNNNKAWLKDCISILSDDKGLREALTNGTDVDYRYIVDTFEGTPNCTDRWAVLSGLAKDKGNAFVISNFPSIKSFNGMSVSTITSTMTLPSDDEGASFLALYTPVKITDNGIKTTIPVAGLVSNLFMDKYTSRQPYYIVAGPNYGVISVTGLVGPEYNFTRDDLDILEPYGVNALIYKPTRGTFINSNQTAKQTPVTALSKINVRELVIYLQDTIADMLQGYQWELNTSTLRDNIKAKADAICEKIMSNGGLYDYENVCDSSNNTDEVIDNEMVVLSTSIEPAKGAGKMVHELTIYSTGQMRSSISE